MKTNPPNPHLTAAAQCREPYEPVEETPKPWAYDLWKHMSSEHGLTLLESELSDIIDLAGKLHRNADRLKWLHDCTTGQTDKDGYEWGIYRVKWENGQAVSVMQTNSDFSDLDAEMAYGAQPK